MHGSEMRLIRVRPREIRMQLAHHELTRGDVGECGPFHWQLESFKPDDHGRDKDFTRGSILIDLVDIYRRIVMIC